MSTIKTLRVLLRRTMAIALLSIPMEAVSGEDRKIALAIDNTPEKDAHEALLDELEKLDIRATLTVPNANRVPDEATQQLDDTIKILRQLSRRPPLSFTPEIPQSTRADDNLTLASPWERLSLSEMEMDDPQEIADFVADNAFPGAVVLLHPKYSQRDEILRVLPAISSRLRAEGYAFTALSELLSAPT